MKLALNIILIVSALNVFGQEEKAVSLKWHLKPNEVLVYKTIIQEIDTASNKYASIKTGGLSEFLADTENIKAEEVISLLQEINKSLQSGNIITNLTKNKSNIIDIEMRLKKNESAISNGNDTTNRKMQELAKAISANILLRGAINNDGSIQSFYVKNEQKNLIAMFFELPSKKIRIGDNWALDINLISMDQNFKCDTSFKQNKVTLINLKKTSDETIAVLKYSIVEYVSGIFNNPAPGSTNIKTTMKMTYTALAEFSLEKGRWITYNGIMSLTSKGVMTSNSIKKFGLDIN